METQDIALCQAIITIPIDPRFRSLNLAQAVAITAYEWRTAHADRPPPANCGNALRGRLDGVTYQGGVTKVKLRTPGGVGHARTPPVWMAPGDVCEIDIEGVGVLSNPIADET